MAEDDDPRWNAATDRIAHRLEDSVAPAQASPATPVITEDTVFEAIFAEEDPLDGRTCDLKEDPVAGELSATAQALLGTLSEPTPTPTTAGVSGVLRMPDAQMDLYNQEEFKDWPVGPEEDYLAGLFIVDISTAERREANEIVELFLTFGAELHEARAKVTELYSPPRVTAQLAKLPQLHLAPGQTFDLRTDRMVAAGISSWQQTELKRGAPSKKKNRTLSLAVHLVRAFAALIGVSTFAVWIQSEFVN